MKDILKNLANLIKVKTIVTVIVVIVWAVLAIKNGVLKDIDSVVTMVLAFYFGTQLEKGGTK